MMQTNETWSPSSWRNYPIAQQPIYTNKEELENALSKLRDLPPLVSREEVDELQQQLKLVHEGKAFVIQCGDCAEAFDGCNPEVIERKATQYEILGKIVEEILRVPVVIIGRIAGQYAKPRSDDFEMINGEKVPVFRGEIVNTLDPTKRNPDPQRLLEAYFRSAATMNQLRQKPDLSIPSKTVIKALVEAGIKENEATSQQFSKFEAAISRAKFENFFTSHEVNILCNCHYT
jgi:3-deoxy-7-phosphoheptulonate synthase